MASRLIVRGANINYVNSNGQTALQICIDNKNVLAVKLLLQKGAHPHIMDLNGEDACDKAQKNGMIKDFP
jgi:ankyrin repeat protein|tara:strand:+ start:301 stop:510 length:210 start_codon:yes stop_codon:yes gene_type:complete